jgi:hypothetical protein
MRTLYHGGTSRAGSQVLASHLRARRVACFHAHFVSAMFERAADLGRARQAAPVPHALARTYAEAATSTRPVADLSEPSASAAFVRSSPPMSVPFMKTCGNVGQPLQSLIASRSLHFEK